MKRLFVAVSFLTILPVPNRLRGAAADLGRSTVAFPFVGLLLGLAVAGVDQFVSRALPQRVSSVLIVIVLLGLSGALHLDGLADTADGLLSSRPRTRILEIMKDSHVGAMGVAAIVTVLALRVSLFDSLPTSQRFGVLAVTPVMSRSAMVWVMQALPYVREEGTGRPFARRPDWLAILVAVLFPPVMGFGFLGWTAVGVCISCLLVTSILMLWFFKKIGGWTGDTLGATSEVVESVPALAVLVATALGGKA